MQDSEHFERATFTANTGTGEIPEKLNEDRPPVGLLLIRVGAGVDWNSIPHSLLSEAALIYTYEPNMAAEATGEAHVITIHKNRKGATEEGGFSWYESNVEWIARHIQENAVLPRACEWTGSSLIPVSLTPDADV